MGKNTKNNRFIRPLKVQTKKDQVMEVAFVLFLITSIAITMVLAAHVYSEIGKQLDGTGLHTNQSKEAFDKFEPAFSIFDGAMIFLVIGLTIGLIVTSFLIPTHPVFVIINIVGFMILVFIGAVYSNTFFSITNSSEAIYNTTLLYYPATTWILTDLPSLAALLIFITSIIMYTKGKQDGRF